MNDTTTTDTQSAVNASVSGPLQTDVLTNPSTLSPVRDYSIAREDQHIADFIKGKDPIYGVAGPVEFTGSVKVPERLSVNALPPHLAGPIRAELASYANPANRDALEHELVTKALEEHSFALRLDAGISGSNDPYWKARYEVARKEKSLSNEALNLASDLTATARVETIYDERGVKVGERVIPKIDGDARKRAERRLLEVQRELIALDAEAPRQFERALFDAVEAHKLIAVQMADNAEVERRANEIVREDRINAAARQRAGQRKNSL